MSITIGWVGDSMSKLWQASNLGDLPLLLRELQNPSGVDLEEADMMGRTPLVEATKYDHPDCVRALLLAGADPKRALDYAGNYPKIKHMLEDAMACKARGEPWTGAAPQNPLCHSRSSSGAYRLQGGEIVNCPPNPKAKAKDKVCRYWLKGSCRYGSRCRFSHAPVPSPFFQYDNNVAQDEDEDEDEDEMDEDLEERMRNMGFSNKEVMILWSLGKRPWDNDAHQIIRALNIDDDNDGDIENDDDSEDEDEDDEEVEHEYGTVHRNANKNDNNRTSLKVLSKAQSTRRSNFHQKQSKGTQSEILLPMEEAFISESEAKKWLSVLLKQYGKRKIMAWLQNPQYNILGEVKQERQ